MMKIAVASDKGNVSAHFGFCEGFAVYDVADGKIAHREFVKNPGHKPGFLPVFLHEMGVNVIVSGGMGGGAVDIFNEKGIEVVLGVSGTADGIVNEYIKGKLEATGTACVDHKH